MSSSTAAARTNAPTVWAGGCAPNPAISPSAVRWVPGVVGTGAVAATEVGEHPSRPGLHDDRRRLQVAWLAGHQRIRHSAVDGLLQQRLSSRVDGGDDREAAVLQEAGSLVAERVGVRSSASI